MAYAAIMSSFPLLFLSAVSWLSRRVAYAKKRIWSVLMSLSSVTFLTSLLVDFGTVLLIFTDSSSGRSVYAKIKPPKKVTKNT